MLPRGGGTSQCGQTVARALVVDCSKYLDRVVSVDVEGRRARVEPGVVLDRLNRLLRKDKLFFPVDPSTASRATIGGMTANNSCGSRSLRYGNMVHNVRGVDALLADGTTAWFGEVPGNFDDKAPMPERYRELVRRMRALHRREADEIERRFPKVLRRVGGYNIDSIERQRPQHGPSAGRLRRHARLLQRDRARPAADPGAPGPRHLPFPELLQRDGGDPAIVELGPSAVELVDRTMIELARDIPMFRPVVDRFVQGEPEALLLTEFAGDDPPENLRRLKALVELMGDLGFPGGVVEAIDPAFQQAVWEVRAQGLNIMMSMKGDGKPISFIEDCAVRLEDLADYTDRLTRIFEKHGTYGTWYAHASVGCLHVRPVLNLKQELEVKKMRAIAEEAFAMVREYKGSHSGEHGDGLVRSEFHEAMFGSRIVRAFEEVKDAFDPAGPVQPRQDRAGAEDGRPQPLPLQAGLPPIADRYRARLVGMGRLRRRGRDVQQQRRLPRPRCRRHVPFLSRDRRRAAPDPRPRQYVAAGAVGPARARRARLGRHARDDGAVHLVQGLQARMPDRRRHGAHEDRVPAPLPQAPRAHAARPADRLSAALCTLRRAHRAAAEPAQPGAGAGQARGAAVRAQRQRKLPQWSSRPYRGSSSGSGREVVLLVDTFNRYFEPENARAAERVLVRAGYRVISPDPASGRPLCCGRTFLSAGLVDEARREARRMLDALSPYLEAGTPIVGLEPSCLLTLRDEFPAILPGAQTKALAERAQLFEEFVESESRGGPLSIAIDANGRPDRVAARPLPPEGVRHRRRCGEGAAADPRAQPSRPSTRPAAAWPARSATRPSITRCR